ncbi:MAG: hypothetical protein KKE71_06495, partial [Nanoarchaeota archaeon]|nr:hypothetical protein [Nanoarchaeota archaeon]
MQEFAKDHRNKSTPPPINPEPADGSTVSGNVTVSVTASDNIGVSKVELYVDET